MSDLQPESTRASYPRTLQECLEHGPLPLETALRFGAGIAAALRTIHQENCAHGELKPELVLVNDFGALLLPPQGAPTQTGTLDDLAAFGALLERMLPGGEPGARVVRTALDPAARAGRDSVLTSARRLALQCSERSPEIDMQKAAVRLRLLAVLSHQYGPESPQPAVISAVTPESPGPAAGSPALPNPRAPEPAAPAVRKSPASAPGTPDFSAHRPASPALPKFPEGKPAAGRSILSPPPPPLAPRTPWIDPKSFLEETPAPEHNLVPSAQHCPKCGGHYVGRSRPRGWFEAGMSSVGIPIRRCCQCFYRYITVLGMNIEKVARNG